MYFKLLKNDFRKNPVSNLILFLFMSLSVTVAVTVTLMLTQLFTSITDMYETANLPHFLQMHKGELVQSDIDKFNKSYDGIEHWQTVPRQNQNTYGGRLCNRLCACVAVIITSYRAYQPYFRATAS